MIVNCAVMTYIVDLALRKVNKQKRQGTHVDEAYLQMLRQSVW